MRPSVATTCGVAFFVMVLLSPSCWADAVRAGAAFATASRIPIGRYSQRGIGVCRRPALLGLRATSREGQESERHPGLDPGAFLEPVHQSLLPAGRVEELFEKGYVVIDDALSAEEHEMLTKSIALLASTDGLAQTPEASVGVRDDYVRFVEEDATMIPIKVAIKRLKGFAEHLQAPFQAAQDDPANDWPSRQAPPISPATTERPLSISPSAQIASFEPGGIYRMHSDNSRGENGARRNHRVITAIAYANQDWTEEDMGSLRLWLNSDELDPHSYPEDDDAREAELIEELGGKGVGHKGQGYVDVAPLAGRVILFRSTLLHQVCASASRPRRALTVWMYAPC